MDYPWFALADTCASKDRYHKAIERLGLDDPGRANVLTNKPSSSSPILSRLFLTILARKAFFGDPVELHARSFMSIEVYPKDPLALL